MALCSWISNHTRSNQTRANPNHNPERQPNTPRRPIGGEKQQIPQTPSNAAKRSGGYQNSNREKMQSHNRDYSLLACSPPGHSFGNFSLFLSSSYPRNRCADIPPLRDSLHHLLPRRTMTSGHAPGPAPALSNCCKRRLPVKWEHVQ